jgi:hypothetical protein
MAHTYDKPRVLSVLVHASSKVGKSTLASSAPTPHLVLDAEGSWKFIKKRKIYWDVRKPVPRWTPEAEWEVCIVNVSSWQDIQTAYTLLSQREHDFRSVSLDSITEVQRRLKANLKGTEALQIQDWGSLLTLMDDQIRKFRDLITQNTNPVECVVMIAETAERNGKWRPHMQGAIAAQLPYMVDICGYLFVEQELDADGQPTKKVRKLYIGSHPSFETGERVQGTLPDNVSDPNIDQMIKTIYDNVNLMEVTQ